VFSASAVAVVDLVNLDRADRQLELALPETQKDRPPAMPAASDAR